MCRVLAEIAELGFLSHLTGEDNVRIRLNRDHSDYLFDRLAGSQVSVIAGGSHMSATRGNHLKTRS